jgi:hypothetical protein
MGADFPDGTPRPAAGGREGRIPLLNNERAIVYRRMNDIPSSWAQRVNVQSMVFCNMGDDSGTGVAFTRGPLHGERKLYGEFLMNARARRGGRIHARRRPSTSSRRPTPPFTNSLWRSPTAWSPITRTCRT